MRIISGKYRGRKIPVPSGFKARPTTDFAREGLFNILSNQIDFDELKVLDLFGGTGSISFEFASRGAKRIDYVESDARSCTYLSKTKSLLGINNIFIHRSDVFRFLNRTSMVFDIIFADPPYELELIPDIPGTILDSGLLDSEGIFILEHGKKHSFSSHPGFREIRKYGSVHFSFFSPIQ